jgi:ribosomal 50S subunit-recycling heat shock protein
MRIDKFLKISRIIKRRTIAKEACDTGRVALNGRTAKAGADVSVGDEIAILFGTNELKLRIIELKETTKKEDAENMYEVIS